QDVYPWLPVRLLSRFRHATREHLAKSNCPLLIVHSRDDEIIPFHHGQALFGAASEPKTFLELRGGHNDAHFRSETAYIDGLRRFLRSTE
ncbi:MAG: alpha/beta hydrolase, partial [Gammaproteobacteria bacterium]|nr:alpha/beta hydrolase [Gammaproteobacteria bacterium]